MYRCTRVADCGHRASPLLLLLLGSTRCSQTSAVLELPCGLVNVAVATKGGSQEAKQHRGDGEVVDVAAARATCPSNARHKPSSWCLRALCEDVENLIAGDRAGRCTVEQSVMRTKAVQSIPCARYKAAHTPCTQTWTFRHLAAGQSASCQGQHSPLQRHSHWRVSLLLGSW